MYRYHASISPTLSSALHLSCPDFEGEGYRCEKGRNDRGGTEISKKVPLIPGSRSYCTSCPASPSLLNPKYPPNVRMYSCMRYQNDWNSCRVPRRCIASDPNAAVSKDESDYADASPPSSLLVNQLIPEVAAALRRQSNPMRLYS